MAHAQALPLEARLEALFEQTGGQVEVTDIAAIVTSVMQAMNGETAAHASGIGDELNDLVLYVEKAKAELALLRPHTMSKRDIPEASDELDAIIAATEDAASKMMDAAEEISELAESVEGELVDQMADITTRIFEASSFQDITGQRITKIVRVLQYLEERLGALAAAIGDTVIDERDAVTYDEAGLVVDDRVILHGPQLPVVANNQDDIDALLASFD